MARRSIQAQTAALPSYQPPNDIHFFNRVKRTLGNRETYNEFLKLVNLFHIGAYRSCTPRREARNFLGDGNIWKGFRVPFRTGLALTSARIAVAPQYGHVGSANAVLVRLAPASLGSETDDGDPVVAIATFFRITYCLFLDFPVISTFGTIWSLSSFPASRLPIHSRLVTYGTFAAPFDTVRVSPTATKYIVALQQRPSKAPFFHVLLPLNIKAQVGRSSSAIARPLDARPSQTQSATQQPAQEGLLGQFVLRTQSLAYQWFMKTWAEEFPFDLGPDTAMDLHNTESRTVAEMYQDALGLA
ncbi:hypothetical protein DEU56DRAFT_902193 [Suillus clintonianus]|uniref:uncharacterized protein n=1 Tax=Suillus clintonianus TaxID=1904413 RepID=UPI001B87E587|nr:uncharacterized protein DEU56DRAFT_902193 [Suillus clintonianus]KAG2133324.1 hypothetical protein DEU56DRAFT_902193 [Suillus clintonianus]